MHLVGFTIRIYHDARSPERQNHIRTEFQFDEVSYVIITQYGSF